MATRVDGGLTPSSDGGSIPPTSTNFIWHCRGLIAGADVDICRPRKSLYQAARTRLIGKFEQARAIELLDRYIGLADSTARPSAAAAWWRKGVAYEQMGEIKKAIACHERCLELDQGYSDAQAAIERLKKSK